MNRKFSWVILLLGLFAMVWGVLRGEVDPLFAKAINLCFECIGLG